HVIEGKLTVGELGVILAYTGQIQGPLDDIGHMVADMQHSLVGGVRALEVFDEPLEIEDKPDAVTLTSAVGAITFEHVTFSYKNGRPVLKNVSFEVQPGEVVAIVGPTGAGKTTLSSLIARFYDPDEG